MADQSYEEEIASALVVSMGQLVRQLRQTPSSEGLTMPETSALARLDRGGPTTSSELAKREQISPQSMGATLAALESRGYLRREADPDDGRRVIFSLTEEGQHVLRERRGARTIRLAEALAADFTRAELRVLERVAPLIERLAQAI